MNWDRIEGNWKQVMGRAREQWGKLTDEDLDVIGGRRDQLVGKIQERYGVVKDDAERQLSEWARQASDAWFALGTKMGAGHDQDEPRSAQRGSSGKPANPVGNKPRP